MGFASESAVVENAMRPMVYPIRVGRMRRDRGTSVARPSVLGNPFVIGVDGDRSEVIAKYRAWFRSALQNDPRVRAAVERLGVKAREGPLTLLCYCSPQACHADVIAEEVRRSAEFDESRR